MTLFKLNESKEMELAPGIRARIINSENMSVAHVTLDSGVVMPEHRHPNEQIVNVIQGELELTVAGEPRVLKPGLVEVLPPDMPHAARALTDCRVIDIFYPVRADWLAKMG
jgi:quercetin dioxygenase-like cupin family protein